VKDSTINPSGDKEKNNVSHGDSTTTANEDDNETEEGERIEDLIQPASANLKGNIGSDDDPPGGKTYQGLPPNLVRSFKIFFFSFLFSTLYFYD
jgi:hypothetical protein